MLAGQVLVPEIEYETIVNQLFEPQKYIELHGVSTGKRKKVQNFSYQISFGRGCWIKFDRDYSAAFGVLVSGNVSQAGRGRCGASNTT